MDKVFLRFANDTGRLAGRPWSFFLCVAVVLVWALTGPLFGYSDTWQLVINTGTTIVTFLMVFLIQNTQNRDNAALQAKLDELIKVTSKADNAFIGIEHLTDEALEDILAECEKTIDARRKTPKPGVQRPLPAPKVAGARSRKTAASRKAG